MASRHLPPFIVDGHKEYKNTIAAAVAALTNTGRFAAGSASVPEIIIIAVCFGKRAPLTPGSSDRNVSCHQASL